MKTVLEIDDDYISYKNFQTPKLYKNNIFLITVVFFILLFVSTVFLILEGFDYRPLKELAKFKRIKSNVGSWLAITNEKTGIEINKGRLLYLSKPDASYFRCLDFGSYYTVGRLNPDNFLPQFVKRGDSGPWLINKSAINDLSAKQMCQYILNKYTIKSLDVNNFITCGTDMYNRLGYSGYFNNNSYCENAISLINSSI